MVFSWGAANMAWRPGQYLTKHTPRAPGHNLRSQIFSVPHLRESNRQRYEEGTNKRHVVNGTEKPYGLNERLLSSFTNIGEHVFDGTGGSGSMMITAMENGRSVTVFEKDPDQFEHIKKVASTLVDKRAKELSGPIRLCETDVPSYLYPVTDVNEDIFGSIGNKDGLKVMSSCDGHRNLFFAPIPFTSLHKHTMVCMCECFQNDG
jgi:hypothetical protein